MPEFNTINESMTRVAIEMLGQLKRASEEALTKECVAGRGPEDQVRCQLTGGTWALPCVSFSFSPFKSQDKQRTKTSHYCSYYAM